MKRKYNVYDSAFRNKVVAYGTENGWRAASEKFKVHYSCISRWRKSGFTPEVKELDFSPEEKAVRDRDNTSEGGKNKIIRELREEIELLKPLALKYLNNK